MLEYRFQKGESPDAPLLVLIHGRAGNARVMWPFSLAAPLGSAIVSFQAPLVDSEKGGFSWWQFSSSGQALQGPAEESAQLFEESFRLFLAKEQIDPREVWGLGFSQGGMVLSVIIQRGIVPFTRAALLGSLAIERVQHADAAGGIFPKPLILIAHGTEDDVIGISKARRSRDYLSSLGYQVGYVEDPVAHKIGSQGMRAIKEFLRATTPF